MSPLERHRRRELRLLIGASALVLVLAFLIMVASFPDPAPGVR